MKPIVLLDIDGVLRDLMSALVSAYRLAFPKAEIDPIDDWYQWDIRPFFRGGKVDAINFLFGEWAGSVFGNARVYAGAVEAVQDLFESGKFDVKYCSHQPELRGELPFTLKILTMQWLRANGFPPADVIYTEDKHLFAGAYLIDDKAETLVKAAKRSFWALCVARPWNQNLAVKMDESNIDRSEWKRGSLRELIDGLIAAG